MLKLFFRTVFCLVMAWALCLPSLAQATSPESQAQIQSLLRAHTEAVEHIKVLLARQLQKEGSAVEPQAITDAVLAARLQSDAGFRTTAVRYLVEQGTITEEQAQDLMGQASGPSPANVELPVSKASGTASAPAANSSEQRFDDSSLNPRTVAQPNPYPTLPSTKALYAQRSEEHTS